MGHSLSEEMLKDFPKKYGAKANLGLQRKLKDIRDSKTAHYSLTDWHVPFMYNFPTRRLYITGQAVPILLRPGVHGGQRLAYAAWAMILTSN